MRGLFDPTKSGPSWALTATICGAIAIAAIAYAGLASKDWARAEHKAQEDRITEVEHQVMTVQHSVERAGDAVERMEKDTTKIAAATDEVRGMLQAMQQVEYERARLSPEHERAWERAARKVRKRAKAAGQGDPLEALQ